VRPVILDVSSRDDITRVIDGIGSDVGSSGLQGLVNNAGVGVGGPFEYLTEEEWRWVFDVNFFGVVALSLAALPMLRAGRPDRAHRLDRGSARESRSRPVLRIEVRARALAESQRQEFARSGSPIKVSLVEPGEVATAIWDKAEESVDDMERKLDAVGTERYQWLIDQSRGFVDEGRAKGVPPSKVADSVEHALTADRPKARYLVGPDAMVAGHVVTRLPDRLRDACNGFGSKRWETRGRKVRDA